MITDKMNIDNTDNKILRELKNDSRKTIREIAKSLGLRPSTVHQRIQKLRKQGVIEKFTIKTDNKAVGENFIVFMHVSTEGAIIPDSAFKDSHIKEVFGVTGEYDLLLKMKFKDVDDFNSFVLDFRNKYKLKKTVTMVATANLKEEY
ncbi:winged helix-turn-helix transcriptional regulator [Candidatus Woesearchaeota archaeon]|nr:winged helix-turn-helix transcriptional regulator [Candidatus Woesearchaeota archaeon]